MILTQHGISAVNMDGPPFYVKGPIVDGVRYKAVKIGNIEWSYPIKYRTSNYYYPNNDINNEYMGLLYQIKIVHDEIEPLLTENWRVPTKQDIEDIIENVDDPMKLISKNFGGNNLYGLNCTLEGYRSSTATYNRFNQMSFFWTKTKYPGWDESYNLLISPTRLELDSGSGTISSIANTALILRLCRDA
jgi:uncharacterized protein (TIGR02145 family)